jgi:hypothetical protein
MLNLFLSRTVKPRLRVAPDLFYFFPATSRDIVVLAPSLF